MFNKIIFILFLLCTSVVNAAVFSLPANGDDVVGSIQRVSALPDEGFHVIGRRFDVGYYEMMEANRNIVKGVGLRAGTDVVVPSQFILPRVPRKGIVINLAELRLYYYPKGGKTVITEPIGIGRIGWLIPLGRFKIIQKQKNPQWFVPKSVKKWAEKDGRFLPDVVEPGPLNPLGKYSIRLSKRQFLIHGTNDASGVGMRSSSGCIRMFPEGIKKLFSHVTVGTPVRIINEPYKVGWLNGRLYLEAHEPLQEDLARNHGKQDFTAMVSQVLELGHPGKTRVSWSKAEHVAEAQTGMPSLIGFDPVSSSSITHQDRS